MLVIIYYCHLKHAHIQRVMCSFCSTLYGHEPKYADYNPFTCMNKQHGALKQLTCVYMSVLINVCACVGVFFPGVRWNGGCYGIYSAVARTLPLNILTEPFHWPAAMMQDSLTPNLS